MEYSIVILGISSGLLELFYCGMLNVLWSTTAFLKIYLYSPVYVYIAVGFRNLQGIAVIDL